MDRERQDFSDWEDDQVAAHLAHLEERAQKTDELEDRVTVLEAAVTGLQTVIEDLSGHLAASNALLAALQQAL